MIEKIGIILFGAIVAGLVALLLGLPVWILWNWLIPDIFSLPKIGFFQAFGLSLLCSLLFKSDSSSD